MSNILWSFAEEKWGVGHLRFPAAGGMGPVTCRPAAVWQRFAILLPSVLLGKKLLCRWIINGECKNRQVCWFWWCILAQEMEISWLLKRQIAKDRTLFCSCVHGGHQPKSNLCFPPEETNVPYKQQTHSLCFASSIQQQLNLMQSLFWRCKQYIVTKLTLCPWGMEQIFL